MSEMIANNILSAIDILVDKKIAEAQFDKTIKAHIVKCEDKNTGRYLVQYQSAYLIAYAKAGELYQINDLVYILIPENNFAYAKTIIGKVPVVEAVKNIIKEDISYEKTSENYFTLSAPITDKKILYSKGTTSNLLNVTQSQMDTLLQQLRESEYFLIYSSYNTQISVLSQDLTKINFGLKFTLEDKEEGLHTFSIDINNFNNNPYCLDQNDVQFSAIKNDLSSNLSAIRTIEFFYTIPANSVIELVSLELYAGNRVQTNVSSYSIQPIGQTINENTIIQTQAPDGTTVMATLGEMLLMLTNHI